MRPGWLVFFLTALLCVSCSKDDGSRVDELISRQNEHTQSISQLSKRVDSVETKLANIEKGVNSLLGGGSAGAAGRGAGRPAGSTFAQTDEYKNIMRQISLLQEQIGVVNGELAGFEKARAESTERENLRDRGAAFRAMNEPEELTRRLDILAKSFSGKIPDAGRRDQFIKEIEGLKARYTAPMSLEQKKTEARQLITWAIDAVDNDQAKGWLEAQLRSLEEQGDTAENEERITRSLQVQRMRELGELTRRYNIPADTVRDSGLISFDPAAFPGLFRRPE